MKLGAGLLAAVLFCGWSVSSMARTELPWVFSIRNNDGWMAMGMLFSATDRNALGGFDLYYGENEDYFGPAVFFGVDPSYSDNIVFPTEPFLTTSGIVFENDAIRERIAYVAPHVYSLQRWSVLTGQYDLNMTGDFTAAEVPEPAVWVGMILGFVLIGSTLRLSRTHT